MISTASILWGLMILAVLAFGIYVTKNATDYPDWFEDDEWPSINL